MRMFRGYRPDPREEYAGKGLTNKSLETPDYEGVMFADGTVVVRWLTEYRSHSVWASWGDFYQVHGHPEYGTVITWYKMTEEAYEPPAPAGNPAGQVRKLLDYIQQTYNGPVQSEEGWYDTSPGDASPAEG